MAPKRMSHKTSAVMCPQGKRPVLIVFLRHAPTDVAQKFLAEQIVIIEKTGKDLGTGLLVTRN
ncbi:hypothetical protein [Sulfuricella sp. T08]|uniref:hypothetical protein n=1 Tax=Sulfuricella sp. T08 TaxID=1632857 RepID=UPI00167680BB|nr:hypothetical protein [Sulfuricella sp. T08]